MPRTCLTSITGAHIRVALDTEAPSTHSLNPCGAKPEDDVTWIIRIVLSATVLLLLSVSTALAQATIAGIVRDASGAILPGVSVEATSPSLTEKVRTAVSDATGQYRIVTLPPTS